MRRCCHQAVISGYVDARAGRWIGGYKGVGMSQEVVFCMRRIRGLHMDGYMGGFVHWEASGS